MSENKYVKVSGVLSHPSLSEPNTMSGKFQVNVTGISAKDKKELEGIGLTLKNGKDKVDAQGNPKPEPDWGWYIVPKGNKPPRIVDRMLDPWPEDKKIGNKTKANVVLNSYDWEFKGKTGTSAGLNYIQVMEHVEYEGASNLLKPEPLPED